MKRREFLKNAFYGSMILGCGGNPLSYEKEYPDLALIQGDEPDKITRKVVELLGGMNKFVAKGDIVMIKPNMAFDKKPAFAACTNPDVVRTLVELCLEAGAKEVRVMDNPVHAAKLTYLSSGIAEAVERVGGKLVYTDPSRLKSVEINGDQLKSAKIYADFIETDKLINVPILKSHSLSRLTIGMKNFLGTVGGNREIFHRKLNANIVDLAAFFKPDLTVLDAYRVMVRNGPVGGSLKDVALNKTVVAGRDFVAVDAMGATLGKYQPKEMGFIKLANKLGHGEMDLQKLKIDMRATRSS